MTLRLLIGSLLLACGLSLAQDTSAYSSAIPVTQRLEKAMVLRVKGDLAGEEKELRELAGFMPYADSIYTRLALLAGQRGDETQSLAYADGALRASHRWPMELVSGYAKEFRPHLVLQEAEWLSDSATIPAEGLYLLRSAETFLKLGKASQASMELGKLRAMHPSPLLLHDMAVCDILQGRFGEAKDRLDSLDASQFIPSMKPAYALALARLGKEKDAIEHLKKMGDSMPEEAMANLGVLLVLQDKGGLEWLERASSMPNASALTRQNLAYAYYASKQYDKALSLFGQLKDSVHPLPEVYYGMALTYIEMGFKDLAMGALAQALFLRNDYVDAMLRLAEMNLDMKRYDEAKELFAFAAYWNPSSFAARQGMAQVLRLQGNSEEATRSALWALQAKSIYKDRNAPLVAVLQFVNSTRNADLEWLGTSGAEMLNSDLQRFSSWPLVDRIHVEKAARSLAGLGDERKVAGAMAKVLGARQLVYGSWQGQDSLLRLDARLVDIASGNVLATGSAMGKLADVRKMEREVALALAGQAGHKEYDAIGEWVSISAQQKLADAKNYLYKGDMKNAQAFAQEALRLDGRVLGALDQNMFISESEAMQKTVAVLPFVKIKGSSDASWMGGGIQEALITDLKKIAGLYLVERVQVEHALAEMSLGQAGLLDSSQVNQFGKQMAVGSTLQGTYAVLGDSIRIEATLRLVSSGEVRMSADVVGKQSDLLKLEEQLAFKILDTLHVNITSYEQRRVVDKDPLALKTLQHRIKEEMAAKDDVGKKQEMQKKQRAFIGRALLCSSVVGTLVSSGMGYAYAKDRSAYDGATENDQATRLGDEAQSSWNSLMVSGALTLVAWAATAAWYAWQYAFAD